MDFTERHLNCFIALYKKEFGEEITRDSALSQLTSLVTLVKATYKPMTEEEYKIVLK